MKTLLAHGASTAHIGRGAWPAICWDDPTLQQTWAQRDKKDNGW
jgi:hypothetical protein